MKTTRVRLPLNRWELSIIIYAGLTALSMLLNYLNGIPAGAAHLELVSPIVP